MSWWNALNPLPIMDPGGIVSGNARQAGSNRSDRPKGDWAGVGQSNWQNYQQGGLPEPSSMAEHALWADHLRSSMLGDYRDPTYALGVWNQNAPGVRDVRAQSLGPVSPMATRPYSREAMSLAAQSAGLAASNAADAYGRGGNPAARAAALAQISRGSSEMIGQAGLQGFGMGLSHVADVNRGNAERDLQSQVYNQQADINNYQALLSLYGAGYGSLLGHGNQMANNYYQGILNERQLQKQKEISEQQMYLGSMAGTGQSAAYAAGM